MRPVRLSCAIRLSFALAFFAMFCACRERSRSAAMADRLVNERMTTDVDSAMIGQLLDTLLGGSAWQGKYHINRPYDPAAINLYIVDGSAAFIREDAKGAEKLSGNCSYAGDKVIFIDDNYLRHFLEHHKVKQESNSAYLLDNQKCFFYWAIGHELGHLVSGHLAGHFEAGPLDRFVKDATLDNREELQADSFFVHAILKRRDLRVSEETLMMLMLNAEIEQKVGPVRAVGVGLLYDYTNEQVVSYTRQPTHPEYVIRLSRMLQISSKATGDLGLQGMIGGFIRQLKETGPVKRVR